jgi:hypothetical protein
MADLIYDAGGEPRGFRLGHTIFTLSGEPVARVWAERAYTFEGAYIGALFKEMVVDKPGVASRPLPPQPKPAPAAPLKGAGPRAPVLCPYEDIWDRAVVQGEARPQAAEDSIDW